MTLLNLLMVPVGGIFWFLGGRGADLDYDKDVPKLHKAWRRVVWPIIAGIVALLNGVPLMWAAATSAGLIGALSLGYGEGKNWIYRIVVALALGAPFMFIHHSAVYPLATLLTFVPLHWLSLKKNWMTWPVVEAMVGAVQGACLALAVLK